MGGAIGPHLDNQIRAIDVGFVEVIGIGPTQHPSQIRVTEAAHRAGKQDCGIRSGWAEYSAVDATSVRDLSHVVGDREDALRIGIAAPGIAIRSGSPVRLVRVLEGVLRQGRSWCWRWRWCDGHCWRRRWRR